VVVLFLALLALLTPPRQHIKVATPPAVSARAGSTVALPIDVTPDAGIHVYAPGATDYQPIAATIDANEHVAVKRTVYPDSERMMFDGESVPVFQKPFRIVVEGTVGRSVKAGARLTLTGRVDYQACDDKVCFIPASLPVSWTIEIKAPK
jgi:DsbC/DsbD-like thiol-disulfide interchange protein